VYEEIELETLELLVEDEEDEEADEELEVTCEVGEELED